MNTLVIIICSLISYLAAENTTSKDNHEKSALRYGLHRTRYCKDFAKSFLCVRKCLDLDYDIAVADKNCKCTCYTKPDKAKYKSKLLPNTTREQKWKSGVPTTKLPIWAQTTKKEPNPTYEGENSEENIVESSTGSIHEAEEHEGEDDEEPEGEHEGEHEGEEEGEHEGENEGEEGEHEGENEGEHGGEQEGEHEEEHEGENKGGQDGEHDAENEGEQEEEPKVEPEPQLEVSSDSTDASPTNALTSATPETNE